MKNPYKILKINKWQSPSDIKAAYRKLALKYHPDKNPGDSKAEEKFKEVSKAYSILTNPEKRRLYDKYGTTEVEEVVATEAEDTLRDIGKSFKLGIKNIIKETTKEESEDDPESKEERERWKTHSEIQKLAMQKGYTLKPGYFYRECEKCEMEGTIVETRGFLSHTILCPCCDGTGFKQERDWRYDARYEREKKKEDNIKEGHDGFGGVVKKYNEKYA